MGRGAPGALGSSTPAGSACGPTPPPHLRDTHPSHILSWKEIRRAREEEIGGCNGIQDGNRAVLKEKVKVRQGWTKYIKHLLNVENESEARVTNAETGGSDFMKMEVA